MPATYSIAMKWIDPDVSRSKARTMFGWLSRAEAWASRSNRAR